LQSTKGVSRHIVPLIGRIPAKDLKRGDAQRMVDAIVIGKTAAIVKTKPRGRAFVTGGAGTAARVAELLGGIWCGQKSAIWCRGKTQSAASKRFAAAPRTACSTIKNCGR
jgi:hypothetical protein